jgi:hypothetical protein
VRFHWTLPACFTTLNHLSLNVGWISPQGVIQQIKTTRESFCSIKGFYNMLTKSNRIAFASIFFALTTAAHATGEGFYMGLNVGETNTHAKTHTFTTNTVPPTQLTVQPSSSGIGERLFFGYNLNNYAAIETGIITHYAPATYSVPASANISTNDPAIRQNSFDMEGKGMYPFGTTGFAVFIKAGFAYMYASSSGVLKPANGSSGATKSLRPLVALGSSYDISPSWVIDLSYQRVSGGGGIQESTFTSLGISYHIVDHYCGQFLC